MDQIKETKANLEEDESKKLEKKKIAQFIKGADESSSESEDTPDDFERFQIYKMQYCSEVDAYTKTANDRLSNLKNFNKIITRLMNKQSSNVGVQTEADWLEV